MFEWVKKLLRKGKGATIDVTSPVTDSWSYGYALSFYVSRFRHHLDKVATALGLHNRFNPNRGCAELYDEWGVLAWVNVQGEMACATNAVITSQRPLPATTQELFVWVLAPLRVEFEVSV